MIRTRNGVSGYVLLLFGILFFLPSLRLDAGGPLVPIPWERLSEKTSTPFSKSALAISPATWKHAESDNFIYHFSNLGVAQGVANEAEFYYGFISRELTKKTADWERKGNIFLFETGDSWTAFKSAGAIDPYTGGLHCNDELYISRPSGRKFSTHTLAHEVVHLVLHRFYGSGIPLWLNEGYAENAGIRSYSTFYRMRGYGSRPWSRPISAEAIIPLQEFFGMRTYPTDPGKNLIFYQQSERLVRFLSTADKPSFAAFLEHMSRGNMVSSALGKAYPTKFPTVAALERDFARYVSQQFAATANSFTRD